MGGDDEDFGLRFAVFDELDPFLNKALLRAFAWFPDDEVDGGGTEKELVGRAVNALAAKILLPDSLLAKEPLRKMSIRDLAEKFEVSEASMGIRLGEPAYSIGAVA